MYTSWLTCLMYLTLDKISFFVKEQNKALINQNFKCQVYKFLSEEKAALGEWINRYSLEGTCGNKGKIMSLINIWPVPHNINNWSVFYITTRGFPGVSLVKNLPASAGDTGDTSSIPGSERFPGGGSGNPLQVFLPEKSHGHRSLVGHHSSWGHKESDTAEHIHTLHYHYCISLHDTRKFCVNSHG